MFQILRIKPHATIACLMAAVSAFFVAPVAVGASEGSSSAPSPNQIVEVAESLIVEIGAVRRGLGVSDSYSGVEPQSDRTPVHVYAKTLELFYKVRRLQAQFGLTPAAARRMPFQPVDAADAMANLEYLVQQMRGIRETLAFDAGSSPTQAAAKATLSTAYERLTVASLMLDGLRGGPLMPDDLFQIASIAFGDLAAIAERLNIALDVRQDAPPSPRPAEIAHDLMRSIEKAIDVQAQLGMVASTAPSFTPTRVTSSAIYDLIGVLVAELSRIGHRAGIDQAPPQPAEFRGKTLRDLYARVLQIHQGLEQFTNDSIALALGRMEEAEESDRRGQDEPREAEAVAVVDEPVAGEVAEVVTGADEPGAAAAGTDGPQAVGEEVAESIADGAAEPEEALDERVGAAPPIDEPVAGEVAEVVTDADEPGAAAAGTDGPQAVGEEAAESIADGAAEPEEALDERVGAAPPVDEPVAGEVAEVVTDADEPGAATEEAEVVEQLGDVVAEADGQEAVTETPGEDVLDASAETALPTKPACGVMLASESSSRGVRYPRGGRRNYGDASIEVQFQIDENGRVIEGKIEALLEQSTATREGSIGLFVRAAIDAVEKWRFEFDDSEDPLCEKSQTLAVRLGFAFEN